jgi:nucleoside-diphosphate-sugar epimerase
MRVLIAGATGATGTQLVPRSADARHDVFAMSRSQSSKVRASQLGAVPVIADALDRAQVEAAVRQAAPEVIADAAEATLAAVENGGRGVYNIVDDDPAPVAEWLPELAAMLGAKKPIRVPRFIGRLAAGPAGVVLMTELRGASNAKAKRELGWHPAHSSWRQGLQV